MAQNTMLKVRLQGTRPLMFDRYAGDNKTQLPTHEKMYLDRDGGLTIPSINIFSLLIAENTKSVCKAIFGKQWKAVAAGIGAYVQINPFDIPILGGDGEQIRWEGSFNEVIKEVRHVARLAKGVPNPKIRPLVELPWAIEFNVTYALNKDCTLGNLRQAFADGGSIGLGTFKPMFGCYELTGWEEQG